MSKIRAVSADRVCTNDHRQLSHIHTKLFMMILRTRNTSISLQNEYVKNSVSFVPIVVNFHAKTRNYDVNSKKKFFFRKPFAIILRKQRTNDPRLELLTTFDLNPGGGRKRKVSFYLGKNFALITVWAVCAFNNTKMDSTINS